MCARCLCKISGRFSLESSSFGVALPSLLSVCGRVALASDLFRRRRSAACVRALHTAMRRSLYSALVARHQFVYDRHFDVVVLPRDATATSEAADAGLAPSLVNGHDDDVDNDEQRLGVALQFVPCGRTTQCIVVALYELPTSSSSSSSSSSSLLTRLDDVAVDELWQLHGLQSPMLSC